MDARTSEMVEKICNFLDEDHYVSLKTISIQLGVGVANVHRIIHEDLNLCKICSQDAQKNRCVSDSREMVIKTGSHPPYNPDLANL